MPSISNEGQGLGRGLDDNELFNLLPCSMVVTAIKDTDFVKPEYWQEREAITAGLVQLLMAELQ